jgi:hypothetical protein
MPANREAAEPCPYGSAAEAYWDHGWRGILPVPPRSKRIQVTGWTGWNGITPSWPDVQAWIEDHADGNVALRMPGFILGIDVDNYSGKVGGATVAACEAMWGELPPTWRTTSRDDGVSGIRLFLIPPGLNWPGQLPGGGVELIHSGHRYAIAPPSIHPEGRRYRWIDPAGLDTLAFPRPEELAPLPDRWIAGLSRGAHVDEPSADMPRAEIGRWLGNLAGVEGPPCRYMSEIATAGQTGMVSASARHEVLLTSMLQAVRAGEKGHHGLHTAARAIRQAFLDAVGADRSRSESEATSEAERALAGAVEKVAAAPSPEASHLDPCNLLAHTREATRELERARATPTASPAPSGPVAPVADPSSPPTRPLSALGKLVAAERDALARPADPQGEANSAERVDTLAAAADDAVAPIERTTWAAEDIEAALLGQHTEGPPTMLARADGKCLLYAARINGIIGPSESGKTWVALEAARQALAAGRRVLLLDFEDSVPGVVGRLLALGVAAAVLRSRFAYVGPSEPLAPLQTIDLLGELAHIGADDLIILDGFNAAMTLQGLDLVSNKDVTMFYLQVLKLLVATRACIVYVDHTPKNDAEGESRGGIGAQAKRAMTTGAILRCDVKTPFGRNQTGYISILVDKDRAGHVRECSPGRRAGTAKIESVTVEAVNTLTVTIEETQEMPAAKNTAGEKYERPTFLMQRVSEWLAAHPGASGRAVRTEVKGKDSYVKLALDALVAEGYVSRTPHGQTEKHALLRPYSEATDLLVPSRAPVPTGAPGTGRATGAPVPVPYRGTGTGHRSAGGPAPDEIDPTGALFESGDDL